MNISIFISKLVPMTHTQKAKVVKKKREALTETMQNKLKVIHNEYRITKENHYNYREEYTYVTDALKELEGKTGFMISISEKTKKLIEQSVPLNLSNKTAKQCNKQEQVSIEKIIKDNKEESNQWKSEMKCRQKRILTILPDLEKTKSRALLEAVDKEIVELTSLIMARFSLSHAAVASKAYQELFKKINEHMKNKDSLKYNEFSKFIEIYAKVKPQIESQQTKTIEKIENIKSMLDQRKSRRCSTYLKEMKAIKSEFNQEVAFIKNQFH